MKLETAMLRYAILVLLALHLMPVAASEASVVPGEEHCVINVSSSDKLNTRNRPSTKARVIIRKRMARAARSMGNCRAEWCPVEDGHIKGWANRRFLSMVSPSLYCTVNQGRLDVVRLRAFPSLRSRILIALERHTCGIAFLPYSRNHWRKVGNGWEGWLNRTEVSGQ